MTKDQLDAIDFQNYFNDTTSTKLEEVLEYLEDRKMLTDTGIAFRNIFWRKFIYDKGIIHKRIK